jgi:hypothetical protein
MEETLAEHRPARVRPPGEFVAYSNYGTALAGHVVAEQYDTTFVALAPTTAIRILNIVGVAFVLTWIYNATGSVLLAILAHTGFNTANSTLVPLPLEVVSAGDSTTILVVTTVVLWIVVAVLLVGTRGRLGYDGDSSDVRRAERSRLDTR